MKGIYVPKGPKSFALFYVARGADTDHLKLFRRFACSYRKMSPGLEHKLYVIFKDFEGNEHLKLALETFSQQNYHPIYTDDETFDVGAYVCAAKQVPCDRVCFLNTNTEILCDGWLAKLAVNLDQPGVGLVGATGSFESLFHLDPQFPRFPNVHVRSNCFMMEREVLLSVLSGCRIRTKKDADFVESGPAGLTRRIFDMGLSALLVGRDGRGYSVPWWSGSQTFRQGTQSNLLAHDNVTRKFRDMPWPEKKEMSVRTWGDYLERGAAVLLPGEGPS
jgi:hypothetical protein